MAQVSARHIGDGAPRQKGQLSTPSPRIFTALLLSSNKPAAALRVRALGTVLSGPWQRKLDSAARMPHASSKKIARQPRARDEEACRSGSGLRCARAAQRGMPSAPAGACLALQLRKRHGNSAPAVQSAQARRLPLRRRPRAAMQQKSWEPHTARAGLRRRAGPHLCFRGRRRSCSRAPRGCWGRRGRSFRFRWQKADFKPDCGLRTSKSSDLKPDCGRKPDLIRLSIILDSCRCFCKRRNHSTPERENAQHTARPEQASTPAESSEKGASFEPRVGCRRGAGQYGQYGQEG